MSIYDRIKRDIAQEYYTDKYPNDGQRFVAWYLRNIYGLDTAEAKSCITDGAGDKQIDAVYVDDQNEIVYIIQGKFTQKTKIDSSPLREIHSAWIQLKDLQHLQENSNDNLAGKIPEISSALNNNYDVCFELVTNSELTKPAHKDFELYRQEFEDCETLDARLIVIDAHSLETRYNESLGISGPGINYDFKLEPGRYMEVNVSGKKAVVAVISLQECLDIPGIKDGSLFRKNVRQSLGKDVKVNKEITASLRNNPGNFFFLHNGITAICSSLEIHDGTMSARDLSVVNGCQSLTTIYNNSEAVKISEGGYIVFRFYEITDDELIDAISTSTNSQNGVKPRDLRSNDRYILAMKKSYEQCYTDGQLITKRGEKQEAGKNKSHVIELPLLGKLLLSWHVQRPNFAHEESKIFVERFSLLFHRDYRPEDIQALNEIFRAVYEKWEAKNDNPLVFNEALLVQRSYAPYLHFFAVSLIICELNKSQEGMIPSPEAALKTMKNSGTFEEIIEAAGNCVNEAFMTAADEAHEAGKVFTPPNWPKSVKSLAAIRSEVRKYIRPRKKEDKDFIADMRGKLNMSKKDFSPIWAD